MKRPKVIVVLGQTATGKSDFAVALARKINGEIISADSRQVYKGLDLLSGKITKKEMKGVPHHLLDVVSLRSIFSVVQFQKKAARAVTDISARGRVPLVIGGTGMYIDALINNTILPEVPPNPKLRTQLEKESLETLCKKLEKLDPIRLQTVDIKNKVRLIRAIEIATVLGSVPEIKQTSPYDVLYLGLTLPDEILRKRIHMRILKRIRQGMVTEAEQLHASGLSWKRMSELGLECRYVALYLQKKISKQELVEQLTTATWQYAKRQKTWFKRNKEIHWMDPNKIPLKLVQDFLH